MSFFRRSSGTCQMSFMIEIMELQPTEQPVHSIGRDGIHLRRALLNVHSGERVEPWSLYGTATVRSNCTGGRLSNVESTVTTPVVAPDVSDAVARPSASVVTS